MHQSTFSSYFIMESLLSSSLPILLTFLIFFLIILKIGKGSKGSNRSLNLPPGPKKLPLIGNLHQLGGSLLHRELRNLAEKYGPFMYLQLGERPTIVVSSPEFAKEVLKTHDIIFASRIQTLAAKVLTYNSSGVGFRPHGDHWRQMRKLTVTEVLSAKRVQSFRSIREEEVSNLINWIASKAGSVINLTQKLFSLSYGITSRSAFGNECKDQEMYISVIDEVTTLLTGSNIADMFPSVQFLQHISGIKSRVEKLHQKADKILSTIINEHKQRKASLKTGKEECLLDVLLSAQENGNLEFPLTMDSIKAVLMEIFSAGSETSATTVDWTLCEMMRNPKVLKKAQAEVREVFNREGKIDETVINEMKYLKLVIKETLRLHPSVPLLLPRECGERCNINGFDVPAKATVIINAWAMGRDPKYWTEPESFIPERFLDCSLDFKGNNFEFIPFGSGRRMCPGITYATANMELPLAMLLYHFDWKLTEGVKPEDLDMTEAFGASVRRKNDLYMVPTLYRPSPVA